MQRRDVLRLVTLSALAVTAGPVLASCGDSPSCGAGCGTVAPSPAALDLVSSDVRREAGDAAAVAGMVTSLHTLGGRILGEVAGAPGNVALSPYSIGVALGLTLNGARGETLSQMTALFDDAAPGTINGGLDALTADIEALAGTVRLGGHQTEQVELSAANALFGQRGEQWQRAFLDTLARSYGAGMHVVDYESDPNGAAAAINGWTAEQTHDKITDLVPVEALDEFTRLVLVNALYFKAAWAVPFDPEATKPADFTGADGSGITVSMMHADLGLAPYASGDGWAATSLPYAGGRLAMTLVLPDAGRLDDVQADLAAGRLPGYLAALAAQRLVTLGLPRFTFRTNADLTAPLKSLGMSAAFDAQGADFSAMTSQDGLFLGDVLHQVFVAVDEHGTEAAAATAVVVETDSLVVGEPVELTFDRPFFFVIHDARHGTPLFLGRVDDPTAS